MSRLDHVRLAVKDWQASRDWYVSNFGFRIEFQIPDGGSEKLGVAALQDDAGLTLFYCATFMKTEITLQGIRL